MVIFFLIWLSNDFRQSTRYICSDPSCEGNEGNHFIRIHVPGALEFETIRSVGESVAFSDGIIFRTASKNV